jgi:hypothetical protein
MTRSTQLKTELWALFTEGGGITRTQYYDQYNEGTMVVHEDPDDKSIWVLLFEDLTHAEHVAGEYKDCTGDTCEVLKTEIRGLDDDQHIRLYRIDGSWKDIRREDYMEQLAQQNKPSFWEKAFPEEEEN